MMNPNCLVSRLYFRQRVRSPPLSITTYLIGKVVTHAGIIPFVHRTVNRMYDVFMVIKVILYIIRKYCLTSGNRRISVHIQAFWLIFSSSLYRFPWNSLSQDYCFTSKFDLFYQGRKKFFVSTLNFCTLLGNKRSTIPTVE